MPVRELQHLCDKLDIDQAAAAMYSLQHDVLASQGIPVQGIGRQAYRT